MRPLECDFEDSCQHRALAVPDGGYLGWRQIGVPDVQNQDDAMAVAVVPHFVLIRIIKDDRLAFFPRSRFFANTQQGAMGNNEAEVTP